MRLAAYTTGLRFPRSKPFNSTKQARSMRALRISELRPLDRYRTRHRRAAALKRSAPVALWMFELAKAAQSFSELTR
jgi:hypothetical protein